MFVIDRPYISELFVYHPGACQKEGDEFKKILYYFPRDKPLDEQLNSIGLCEAVITFTKFFGSSCRSLHTKKTKRFFQELSQDVWIVIVVSVPDINNKITDSISENDTINDDVLESVLSTACETFELFHGKIDSIIKSFGYDILKSKLEHFFSRYLRTMLFEHCDILDCFNGIQFMAIEPSDFARVQGLLNRILYAFTCIEHVTFFYEGRLVHSTLDLSYVRHIYCYLNSFLFIEQPDLTHTAALDKTRHLGRYLVGPKNSNNNEDKVQCPILCSPTSDLPNCQLITYQALRLVVCLLVKGVDLIPMEFFIQFERMVGPRLILVADRLASSQACSLTGGSVFPLHLMEDMSTANTLPVSNLTHKDLLENGMTNAIEHFDYANSSLLSSPYIDRFVYWNPFTCAFTTTLHVFTGSGRRPIKGAKSILNLMANLRNELMFRPNSWCEEIGIRLDPYGWIVCQKSNGREVYMFFMIKHESLNKLDRSICRVHTTTFRRLFLLA